MEISELQEKVTELAKEYELETKIEIRLLDLMSELGELSKESLKSSDYGNVVFKPTDKWVDELGDVFFSLLCVANNTEVDLEVALNKALNKYSKRFNKKGEICSEK